MAARLTRAQLEQFSAIEGVFWVGGGSGALNLTGGRFKAGSLLLDLGDDVVTMAGNIPTGFTYLSGGGGNDQLIGSEGSDGLDGDAGNDRLEGRGGDDFLNGGDGDDVVLGGAGKDEIRDGIGNCRSGSPLPRRAASSRVSRRSRVATSSPSA